MVSQHYPEQGRDGPHAPQVAVECNHILSPHRPAQCHQRDSKEEEGDPSPEGEQANTPCRRLHRQRDGWHQGQVDDLSLLLAVAAII